MSRIVNGEGSFRVLFVHGWMHSSQRYRAVAEALDNSRCDLIDLPGFGGQPAARGGLVEQHHRDALVALLERESYDCIVAHSWGGNVLLKAIAHRGVALDDTVLLLLSPAYNGLPALRATLPLMPLFLLLLVLQKRLPRAVTYPCVRLAAWPSVRRWRDIDTLLLEDARRADPMTAVRVAATLALDRWELPDPALCPRARVVHGGHDRMVPARQVQKLCRTLGVECVLEPDIGHTLVVERPARLLELLEEARAAVIPPSERSQAQLARPFYSNRAKSQVFLTQ